MFDSSGVSQTFYAAISLHFAVVAHVHYIHVFLEVLVTPVMVCCLFKSKYQEV